MRLSTILYSIAAIALAFSGLFYVTLKVEALEDQLVQLNREIMKEQESIHMLEAEWSYFNRPERIQKLTETVLPELQPLEPKQFVSVQILPFKPEAAATDMPEGEFIIENAQPVSYSQEVSQ